MLRLLLQKYIAFYSQYICSRVQVFADCLFYLFLASVVCWSAVAFCLVCFTIPKAPLWKSMLSCVPLVSDKSWNFWKSDWPPPVANRTKGSVNILSFSSADFWINLGDGRLHASVKFWVFLQIGDCNVCFARIIMALKCPNPYSQGCFTQILPSHSPRNSV